MPDKLLNCIRIIGVVVFATFALVQVNDPDPWVWVGVYALGVLGNVMSPNRARATQVYLMVILIAIVCATTLRPVWPPLAMDHEETREFLGTLIVAAWTGSLWGLAGWSRRVRKQTAAPR